eukprot:4839458-Amphidinium_carterae.1
MGNIAWGSLEAALVVLDVLASLAPSQDLFWSAALQQHVMLVLAFSLCAITIVMNRYHDDLSDDDDADEFLAFYYHKIDRLCYLLHLWVGWSTLHVPKECEEQSHHKDTLQSTVCWSNELEDVALRPANLTKQEIRSVNTQRGLADSKSCTHLRLASCRLILSVLTQSFAVASRLPPCQLKS